MKEPIYKKTVVPTVMFCADTIKQLKLTLPVIISIFLVNISLAGTRTRPAQMTARCRARPNRRQQREDGIFF